MADGADLILGSTRRAVKALNEFGTYETHGDSYQEWRKRLANA